MLFSPECRTLNVFEETNLTFGTESLLRSKTLGKTVVDKVFSFKDGIMFFKK